MWLMVLGCTSHPSEWWGRYPWFARGLPDWCLVELLGGWRRAVLLGLVPHGSRGSWTAGRVGVRVSEPTRRLMPWAPPARNLRC